ncbi:MAG: DMT family transporter, partial [Gammaproteobacteria bacterium]|nr:DMT family transporter [Gammaproteobacteria bacterium]
MTAQSAAAERPLLAIGLVVMAMVLFSATDGAAKHLTTRLSAEQILWVRYAVVLGVLLPFIACKRGGPVFATRKPGLHIARGLLVTLSSLLFTSALAHLPLALCTALGFVAPLYVTALSIPFLGERVGVRRWVAVGVGFLGVMVILRPGTAGFEWPMLIPLLSSLCWAGSLIITRVMRGSERALTVLAWSSLVGFVAMAPLAVPSWRAPDTFEWSLLVSVGLLNALAQYLVIHAF